MGHQHFPGRPRLTEPRVQRVGILHEVGREPLDIRRLTALHEKSSLDGRQDLAGRHVDNAYRFPWTGVRRGEYLLVGADLGVDRGGPVADDPEPVRQISDTHAGTNARALIDDNSPAAFFRHVSLPGMASPKTVKLAE